MTEENLAAELVMPLSVLAAVTMLYAIRDEEGYQDFVRWHRKNIPTEVPPGSGFKEGPPPQEIIHEAAMTFITLAMKAVTPKQATAAFMAEIFKRGGGN